MSPHRKNDFAARPRRNGVETEPGRALLAGGCRNALSLPGLTRQSIILAKIPLQLSATRTIDGRVKPGNDASF
jgi:hypothetical protein